MQPHQTIESMLALASATGPFTSWLAQRLWTQAEREAWLQLPTAAHLGAAPSHHRAWKLQLPG